MYLFCVGKFPGVLSVMKICAKLVSVCCVIVVINYDPRDVTSLWAGVTRSIHNVK